MSTTTEQMVALPDWPEEQQGKDIAELRMYSSASNEARLQACDIVARIIPLSFQGAGLGIEKRVALLAEGSGHSASQIRIFRRVGGRWTKAERAATVGVLIDWTAISLACRYAGGAKADIVDPIKVLVALAQDRKQSGDDTPVSEKHFEAAFATAVESAVPVVAIPDDEFVEPPLTLDDVLDRVGSHPGGASPLDVIEEAIEEVKGASPAAKTEAKNVAAEVLELVADSKLVVYKYKQIMDTPAALPVRKAIVAYIRTLMEGCEIADNEVSHGA